MMSPVLTASHPFPSSFLDNPGFGIAPTHPLRLTYSNDIHFAFPSPDHNPSTHSISFVVPTPSLSPSQKSLLNCIQTHASLRKGTKLGTS